MSRCHASGRRCTGHPELVAPRECGAARQSGQQLGDIGPVCERIRYGTSCSAVISSVGVLPFHRLVSTEGEEAVAAQPRITDRAAFFVHSVATKVGIRAE